MRDGVLEYWSIGVLEYWSIGDSVWSNGVVEWWGECPGATRFAKAWSL